MGPALGPFLPAWAVEDNWRWALWITVIIASVVLVLLLFQPETQPNTILFHRARRLRAVTGNPAYRALSEVKPLDFFHTLCTALTKPTEISLKDPAIGFAVTYVAIVYAT
jgi:MFS transporter, DHA1 family, multidrug resistance protein